MNKNKSILKILPVKKDNDKPSIINEILPQHPFCCCVVAPPKSGKTNLIMNLLSNDKFYYSGNENDKDNPSFFDEIYYFSPTSRFDKSSKKILSAMDNVIQIDDVEDLYNCETYIQEIMKSQKEWDENKEGKPRPKILLVFDDMIGILAQTKVDVLSTKYRHYGFSVIVNSQSYKKLPSVLRNCMSHFIWFNLMSHRENEKLYEEHTQSIPNYWEFIKLLDKKYSFMYYNIEEQRLYYNFDKLLWSKMDYLN
jgi:hypothetical protein